MFCWGVTEDGTHSRCFLCSGSVSCVLSDSVSLAYPTLALLAFLWAAHCFWGTFLGNPLLRHTELGHNAALCCSAWLHDGYFLCYLDLSFLFRPSNFPLSSSPKWAILGRNQTFALDHISGDICGFFFSPNMDFSKL